MSGIAATLTQGGRLVLPAKVRSQLHLEDGDRLVIEVHGDSLTVTPVRVKIQEAQKLVAKYIKPGGSLVDDLLAERRQEFAREVGE
ncbi:MAG: AbrB/MazE/SpoVT family DNA-binding domain-containing protein [Acidobacteria bacterium]|nr:AbrB/MazE/SpoVT family DNA-binding domain-containing protein [Acidobacteriota bacterium]